MIYKNVRKFFIKCFIVRKHKILTKKVEDYGVSVKILYIRKKFTLTNIKDVMRRIRRVKA